LTLIDAFSAQTTIFYLFCPSTALATCRLTSGRILSLSLLRFCFPTLLSPQQSAENVRTLLLFWHSFALDLIANRSFGRLLLRLQLPFESDAILNTFSSITLLELRLRGIKMRESLFVVNRSLPVALSLFFWPLFWSSFICFPHFKHLRHLQTDPPFRPLLFVHNHFTSTPVP
jgi:hypothetical protein